MAYTLKLQETLDALNDIEHPLAESFAKALCGVGAAMAAALAVSAGVEAGETNEDLFVATPFFPVYRGQPLPDALAGYDAPSEWEAAAQETELPDAPDVGKVQVGAEFLTEEGFVLLDGEDGEEDELQAALALVPLSSWGEDSAGFYANQVTAAFVKRWGPDDSPSEIWVTDAEATLVGRDCQYFTRVR